MSADPKALCALMLRELELAHPERAVAVTQSPGRPWQFDVTVGPVPPSPAWASFQFEVTEPARTKSDERVVVSLLFAVVAKMLEEYGRNRPGKVMVQ